METSSFKAFVDYMPLILEGTIVTIQIAVVSLIFSVFLGVVAALGKLSQNILLNKITGLYTTIIRGIPDLILMLLLYYGGQIMLNDLFDLLGIEEYWQIEPFTAGALTLGFIYGAYMCETFRGAILAISKGMIEAGHAFGLSNRKVFLRITLPQMVCHALPGFFNNWQVLLKSTALVSIIGLDDMVRKTKIASDNTRMPFTFMLTSAFIYLLITTVSIWFIRYLEKKYPAIG